MLTDCLQRQAKLVATLVEGVTARQLEPVIARRVAAQEWELMSLAIITAAELPARLLIGALLENGQYLALVPGACLRRQQRQPMALAGSGGRSVFRDLDAEEEAVVPEHIQQETDEITAAANSRRHVASLQAAGVDRDPLREYIVTRLAELLPTESEALLPLVTIARAAAWEDTRRTAAMKLTNSRRAAERLVTTGRTAELLEVAANTGMQAARQNLAGQIGGHLEALRAAGDTATLRFLSENHPEEEVRARAQAPPARC